MFSTSVCSSSLDLTSTPSCSVYSFWRWTTTKASASCVPGSQISTTILSGWHSDICAIRFNVKMSAFCQTECVCVCVCVSCSRNNQRLFPQNSGNQPAGHCSSVAECLLRGRNRMLTCTAGRHQSWAGTFANISTRDLYLQLPCSMPPVPAYIVKEKAPLVCQCNKTCKFRLLTWNGICHDTEQ